MVATGSGRNRTLVIGLGNTLFQDDGLGILAVRKLKRAYALPESVEVLEGTTSAMDLLRPIRESGRVIIADALKTGAAPGTVVRIPNEKIPDRFDARLSPHEMRLPDLMALLKVLGEAPESVIVIGMEGATFGQGAGLSPLVSERLDEMVEMIGKELESHGLRVVRV